MADVHAPTTMLGSFGAWAGFELRIPTITLELPSHHSRQRCWRDNREALLAFIVPAGSGPFPRSAEGHSSAAAWRRSKPPQADGT